VEAGLNLRCRENLASLKAALETAAAASAETVVIAGDLLDTMRPTPQAMAEVARVLAAGANSIHRIFLIPGNHDRNSSLPGDHALGVFVGLARVKVLDKPTQVTCADDSDIVLIPFRSEPVEHWLGASLENLLPETGNRCRVLVMHQGIKDDTMPEWMRNSTDAIHINVLGNLCAKYDIGLVLAAHWHAHRTWEWAAGSFKADFVQIGALNPTGFSDPGSDYGRVALVSREGLVSFGRVHGPRFLTLRDPAASFDAASADRLHIRYVVPPERLNEAVERAKSDLAKGLVVGAHADADDSLVEAATRTAAKEAASAETLEHALAAYVMAMPLDEGVDREAVLTECRRLLGV